MSVDEMPGVLVLLNSQMAARHGELLPYDLADLGAVAVETRDETTMSRPKGGAVLLLAGFITEEDRDGAADWVMKQVPGAEVTRTVIRDDGWRDGWKRFFQPQVLEQLQVIAPWMTPPRTDRLTVVVDPGAAFGTGGHATTRLVLSFLEQMASQGTLPARLVDVGCGSGVLSIAARLLGASNIFGFDIDPDCIAAAEENAGRNRVTDGCRFEVAEPKDVLGTWPLVLANIQMAVFQLCVDEVVRLVAPSGRLVVSGILVEQADEAVRLFGGLRLLEKRASGEWVGFLFEREK